MINPSIEIELSKFIGCVRHYSPNVFINKRYELIVVPSKNLYFRLEDVTAGYQSNVKYHIGNAIKYLIRAPFKNNTVEDLKKAVWYIQRAIEKLEGEE